MNVNWLQKGVFSTADIDPAQTSGAGGLLSPQQATEFLRVAIEDTVIMKEARVETSSSPKFEVPRISLSSRILRPGVEGQALGSSDIAEPTTGLVTLSTVLFKGEIQMTTELLEDNIEGPAFADRIASDLAKAVGRDIEEIAVKSDTDRVSGDNEPWFDQLNGIIAQCQDNLPTGQKVDASTYTSYIRLFGDMVAAMPSRYLSNWNQLRIYAPYAHVHQYLNTLMARGTPLGDTVITEGYGAKFRGIPVVGVPALSGQGSINSTVVYYDRFLILTVPSNIIFGFHRRMKIEPYYDPRSGVESRIVTVRFDVKLADPACAVLAYGANSANFTE